MSNEITVKLKCSISEIKNILKNKDFKKYPINKNLKSSLSFKVENYEMWYLCKSIY